MEQNDVDAQKCQFLLGYLELLESTGCHLYGYQGDSWVAHISERKVEDGRVEFIRHACGLSHWSPELRQKVLEVVTGTKYPVYFLPSGHLEIAQQFRPDELEANPEFVEELLEGLRSHRYDLNLPEVWRGPAIAKWEEWLTWINRGRTESTWLPEALGNLAANQFALVPEVARLEFVSPGVVNVTVGERTE